MLGHFAKNSLRNDCRAVVDGLAKSLVKIAPACGHLHDIRMVQAHLRRLHARETLRAQMNLLIGGHQMPPTPMRAWASSPAGAMGGSSGAGAILTSCGAGTGIALHTADAACASSSTAAICTLPQQ